MRLEYVPDTVQPDVRFEFEIEEILVYFPVHLKALEAAPENYSPHKQIVRDHQDRMQPLIELQARIRHIVEQREGGSLTWADFTSWNWSPTFVVANLLEYGFGIVTCPACQEVYAGANLILYDWSWAEYGGRLFTCLKDHELLRSGERMGELLVCERPFKRTLRRV